MNKQLEELNKATYMEEAREHLDDLEEVLLELEEAPDDMELIGRAFRAMHTIKGSGAMFGFDEIAEFVHEIETVYDMVRNGELPVTKELIVQTLAAHDHIGSLLQAAESGEEIDKDKGSEIISVFKKLIPDNDSSASEKRSESETPKSVSAKEEVTYRIRFKPAANIFANGTNPIPLLEELRELGDCLVIAQVSNIPALTEMDPEACYTFWDIILSTDKGINAIQDVFIFVADDDNLKIEIINDNNSLNNETSYQKLGEILINRGDLKPDELDKILQEKKLIGERLEEVGLVNADQVKSALAEQKQLKNIQTKRKAVQSVSSIRVASAKLDKLVDLVGEMVTSQARLSQLAASRYDSDLLSISEEVERLVTELRDNTMSIRMLPISTIFNKFRRLVRDLAAELGQEVAMVTEGAETELDKTMIEQLNDPLVHLVRNSIDHGIESPEIRKAAGKKEEGIIHLSAIHSGADVLIRVRDDGAGLDAETIRAKAVERGVIAPEASLSEKEIFNLIFAPGFSTAKTVTSISGRGVGMDVVKKSIESLRGSVELDSQKGVGTTVTLKLPLTLAIIEGFLVKIGQEYFILPLAAVVESIELTAQDVANSHGRRVTQVRDEIVPYISLREQFKIEGAGPEIEQIVIVQIENKRVGFAVDEVIGQHQTVIKSLGKAFTNLEGISGATIMADGTVALILDINKLYQLQQLAEAN